ncbi:MAG TPA: hypothetical protein VG929_09330 [Actinomycetota bacterium]|nr:hypothetical protein [Actinomycetota bacterium]
MGSRVERTATMLAVLILLVSSSAVSVAGPLGGLDAGAQAFPNAAVESQTYRAVDGQGGAKTAQWRVVRNTGNCCENYLSATSDGKILDFGAGRLRLSSDQGATWQTIRPTLPVAIGDGGEGAVVPAPNGDIVAMNWDPWTGDRLETFKYEAASGKWFYSHGVLKTPFYDRPWLSVVPGPFTVGAETFPYLSILKAGWPSKDIWYYSYDGLNYLRPASKISEELATIAKRTPMLAKDAAIDWVQPLTMSGIAPLPGGGAIASDMDLLNVGDPFALMLAPEVRWNSFRFAQTLPAGRVLADSTGKLHHMTLAIPGRGSFEYRISDDSGASWRTAASLLLPPGFVAEEWDFKANGALGITALAVHAHDAARNVDQDFLYELAVTGTQAALRNVFYVGSGDLAFGSSFGASLRYDFASVAILPDGTLVTSFVDDAHRSPAIAVLTDRGSSPAPPAPPTSTPSTGSPEDPPAEPDPESSEGTRVHDRTVALALKRHLMARGIVTTTGGHAACQGGVPVEVQRRSNGAWRTVANVTTTEDGAFRTRLGDGAGRYRVVARKLETPMGTCAGATSTVVRHRHD